MRWIVMSPTVKLVRIPVLPGKALARAILERPPLASKPNELPRNSAIKRGDTESTASKLVIARRAAAKQSPSVLSQAGGGLLRFARNESHFVAPRLRSEFLGRRTCDAGDGIAAPSRPPR